MTRPEVSTDSDTTGRSIVITGGTRGIGAAIARRFLSAGDRVMVCARHEPPELPNSGGQVADFIACDVRDPEQATGLIQETVHRFGRLDVVINNAGGSPAADSRTVSPRFVTSVITLNLIAPFHMSQAGYRAMADRGGQIINIGSVASLDPEPGTAAYAAAKAGLTTLTRALAIEFAPAVRVNQVTVGLVETELAEDVYGDHDIRERIAKLVPMRRMATPEDVAAACWLLAGPDAAYINGAELRVDGGGELPARRVVR